MLLFYTNSDFRGELGAKTLQWLRSRYFSEPRYAAYWDAEDDRKRAEEEAEAKKKADEQAALYARWRELYAADPNAGLVPPPGTPPADVAAEQASTSGQSTTAPAPTDQAEEEEDDDDSMSISNVRVG